MRIPGFTAEASLFKTDESYRLMGAWAGGVDAQAVIPQQICCYQEWGQCLICTPFTCQVQFGPCPDGCPQCQWPWA